MTRGEFKRVSRHSIQAELNAIDEEYCSIRDTYRRYELRKRRRDLEAKLAESSESERLDAIKRLERGAGLVGKFGLAISYAELLLDRLKEDRWPGALRCEAFLQECRLLLGNDLITMHAQNAAMRTSLKRFKKMQLMVDGRRFYVYVLPPAREQLLHIFNTAPRGFGLRERAREVLITRHGHDPGPADETPAV